MTDPLYLLDTNICIYIINRKPERVFQHLRGLRAGQWRRSYRPWAAQQWT